jgi:hypothetical protein
MPTVLPIVVGFVVTTPRRFFERAVLASEEWTFSGELEGLDEDDPEMFFRLGL